MCAHAQATTNPPCPANGTRGAHIRIATRTCTRAHAPAPAHAHAHAHSHAHAHTRAHAHAHARQWTQCPHPHTHTPTHPHTHTPTHPHTWAACKRSRHWPRSPSTAASATDMRARSAWVVSRRAAAVSRPVTASARAGFKAWTCVEKGAGARARSMGVEEGIATPWGCGAHPPPLALLRC